MTRVVFSDWDISKDKYIMFSDWDISKDKYIHWWK